MKTNNILVAPTYSYGKAGIFTKQPSIREVLFEWLDAINFIKYHDRKLIPLFFCFHIFTFICLLVFLVYHLSLFSSFIVLFFMFFVGTIYNTIWYHRYCSHFSFQFKKDVYKLLFLWTNPILFREECYALPHQIHHQLSDRSGDPYGPHLGWLGNYLAQESAQKFNTNISESEYDLIKQRIKHIGLKTNTYNTFKKTGSIEQVPHYLTRVVFAQIFWILVMNFLGGLQLVITWYAALCITLFLMRDFNWWGHGGNFRYTKKPGWEYEMRSRALNQHFFGYLASEWHNNHHLYPMSANNGFLPMQYDVAFLIIKMLCWLGIIGTYIDAYSTFKSKFHRKETVSCPTVVAELPNGKNITGNNLIPYKNNQVKLRKQIKEYVEQSKNLQSYLTKDPKKWLSFQEQFTTAVDDITKKINSIEAYYEQSESKKNNQKKVFVNKWRKYILHGELATWALTKPYGYAGDFKIMEDIYLNNISSEGYSALCDKYFQNMGPSIATRRRKEDFKMLIYNFVVSQQKSVRIMNLGSGSCRELKELYDEHPSIKSKTLIDCYDIDDRAIDYAKGLLRGIEGINFFKVNAYRLALVRDIKKSISREYDLIYSTGLFDYLDDSVAIRLVTNLRNILTTNGLMCISNYMERDNNRWAGLMEWVCEWYLIHRSEHQFIKIFLTAGFRKEDIKIIHGFGNIMQYGIAQKSQ